MLKYVVERDIPGAGKLLVYIATDEQVVREYAQQGGFQAHRISQVRTVIDESTSEG